MKQRKPKSKLLDALRRGKGVLILISGTEHAYYVQQALRNGLCVYCNQNSVNLGVLEPPLCAKKDPDHEFWNSEVAELGVCELVRMLDSFSPGGWYFHRPIYGLVLNWGWFRKRFFCIKRKNRNQVFEN